MAAAARKGRATAPRVAEHAAWLPKRRDVATVTSFTVKGTVYRVLVGAELGLREPPRSVGEPPKAAAAAAAEFKIRQGTILGRPYRVAVACTCPDWKHNTGAETGCKHMMLVNGTLLGNQYATAGPSARSHTAYNNAATPSTPMSTTSPFTVTPPATGGEDEDTPLGISAI